jgi:hypothetical protein
MLTEAQRELWDVYQRVEARAVRADKLRSLTAFLDCLTKSPGSEWFPWARSLAEAVVDKGESLTIRVPLFEQAIFPALLTGYRAGLPGCARWLAGLFDLLSRSRNCLEKLPEAERSEVGLLRAALRHDPTDQRSRRRLLEKLATRLRYSVPELPAGVLYGIDGASAEQCLELEKELEEFSLLASEEGKEHHYGELIGRCRFHFRAYRDYLLIPRACLSYAQYLCQVTGNGPA